MEDQHEPVPAEPDDLGAAAAPDQRIRCRYLAVETPGERAAAPRRVNQLAERRRVR